MQAFDAERVASLDKVHRINLANSATGFKSANLIATRGADGHTNVAIFSSVAHLGSNPPLLGFVLRPTTVPRGTYANILETKRFTVNHVTAPIIYDAHQSAAKYRHGDSEFNHTSLEEEYIDGVEVPFVKQSPVRILCTYLNEYPIAENRTVHIIASMDTIYCDESILGEDCWIDLGKGGVVTLDGFDGYASVRVIDRLSYPRPKSWPKSVFGVEPEQ